VSALIFADADWDEQDLRDRLLRQFDDFELILLKPSEHTMYFEANNVQRAVKQHDGPVFLICTNALFSAIAAAKLSRILQKFQVMEWTGERFRVLEAP